MQSHTCQDTNWAIGCTYEINETQNCTIPQPEQDVILITQVYYDAYLGEPDGEWFELFNPTSHAVDLDGWKVGDNTNNWSFPQNTSIQNGSYLVIAHDLVTFQTRYPDCAPHIADFTRPLSNTQDMLVVFNLTDTADFVAWGGFVLNGTPWDISADEDFAIVRNGTVDTNTSADWLSNHLAVPSCA